MAPERKAALDYEVRVFLTPREREVALLVERNLSNDEIARKLGVTRGTVKAHVHNIYVKLGVESSGRSSRRATTKVGIERIREAQRRRWQRWRAGRSGDNS